MNYSPEVIIIAGRLEAFLKSQRVKGLTTPEKPISAATIVEHAARKIDSKGKPLPNSMIFRREDVYLAIHYLREQNVPIASGQRGYFYALKASEFDEMIIEQIKIIKEKQETLVLAKRLRENLFKAENSMFESPAGMIIQKELEPEPFNMKDEKIGTTIKEEKND